MLSPLGWLVAATFFHFASLYYLLPTLPLYVQDLGGSTSDVGLVIGILALTSLTARPVLGVWMDRAGRRRFLMAGAAIYIVASLGYRTIQSVPGLLLWRVFHAVGLASFSTAATSLAADLAPKGRRGATIGVLGVAQASALTVGPGTGQVLLATLGYPGLFLVSSSTALVALLSTFMLPAESSAAIRPAQRSGTEGRGSWHGLALPATIQLAASVCYGTIISFIAVVARDRELEVVGVFFALLALSSLGIRLPAGRAYDLWGVAFLLMPLLITLATGMLLLAVAREPLFFLAAAPLAGLGIGGIHTILMSAVVDGLPIERRATGVGTFGACWELGVGAGTILMGRIADAGGFQVMFLVAAALPLLGLAVLPRLDKGRNTASSPARSEEGSAGTGSARPRDSAKH